VEGCEALNPGVPQGAPKFFFESILPPPGRRQTDQRESQRNKFSEIKISKIVKSKNRKSKTFQIDDRCNFVRRNQLLVLKIVGEILALLLAPFIIALAYKIHRGQTVSQ
jgi:hypothetical protein